MHGRAEKAGVHRMGEIHRGKPKPLRPLKVVEKVVTDPSRDALLTDFGKTTLDDRYLLPGESYQDMFARVATAYADDIEHAQRHLRLHLQALVHAGDAGAVERRRRARPADLLLLERGRRLLDGIMDTWNENVWLASNGGGIGTYWGGVRSIGEKVGQNGQTSAASFRSFA